MIDHAGAPSETALVEGRGLGRRHANEPRWILDGVSLAVRPGDRIVVEGPTGSGKTLLLRALALLDPADRGEVLWRGEPVPTDRVPEFRAEVLYLHQRPALDGETVEEILRLPFRFGVHAGRRFSRRAARELLRPLGRDEAGFLAQPAVRLSGGEAQIVAVVRALLLEPQVLLLDEPTASLDAAATEAVERLVSTWQAADPDARAWVWVTHDSEQATRLGRRRLRLEAGRLVTENGAEG